MEKFDLQFNNPDSAIITTSEMLDESIFWQIVDDSLQHTEDQDEQEEYLIAEIEKLTPSEIVGFRLRTDKLLYDTYTSEMWCAGYIMNGGCSDDGFEYFRLWVISRGKTVYENAKINPDSLIAQVNDDSFDDYEFEEFWYVALEAFKNKTGKELYDYIDYEHFTTREGMYPEIDDTWNEDEPETMKKICPQLYERLSYEDEED